MKQAIFALAFAMLFLTAGPANAEDPWIRYEGGDGPGRGRHIVLVSGDEEYRSEEALPQLGKILAVQHGFTCTVLFGIDPETGAIDPNNRKNIPGLAALADADLMIIATRFRDLPDDQMAHIDRYVRAGKPIVGMRTATHAFNIESSATYKRYTFNNKEPDYEQGFGRQVLGETWISHHGHHKRESTRGVIAPGATGHPIARGLGEGTVWGPTDVYGVRLPLTGDGEAIVLGQVLAGMKPDDEPVAGEKNDPLMPVAWTRTYAGDDGTRGRVFTTTMGAATDLLAAGTRRLLVNGTYWALGMERAIPVGGTSADIVGVFDPTDYGFGGAQRGMRPSDHALGATGIVPPPPDPGGRFALAPETRIVLVGNTFAERLAFSGYFEALAHAAHPDYELVIRQVPWSADEVGLRPREHSVPTIEDHLTAYDADVVFMCFGMSESFAGDDGLGAFEDALAGQIDALHRQRFNGTAPPRLVLVSPVAHEDLGAPWVTGLDVDRRNQTLAAYTAVMERVARSRGVRFVDLFAASQAQYDLERDALTSNGIHPNEQGCMHFTAALGEQLGWMDDPPGSTDTPEAAARLRELAYDKHYHERLLYRPTNTEYVWGRRAKPYGVVNFPPEMKQLERMIAARDGAMWEMDKPAPAALLATAPTGPALWERVPTSQMLPDDTWTAPPVEAKGTETSLGSLEILPPDEFVNSFTVPEGYVIECFASELDFAELANPLAMTFDAEGRLWVLCAPTYPHLMPGTAPRGKLLVIEDTDGDGHADQRTVFVDDLYIPTGFAVDTDGVYVGIAPDLWKLWDSDGDGRADRRAIVASGFGMPDAHHELSAFEWDPNGGLMLHEGVFTKSNIETPYGTRRARDAVVWRFDPRSGRLQRMSHCSFANPWGHVHDDYGQAVLADASGGANFAFSHVIMAAEYPQKPRRRGHLLNRGRPTAGCELISSRHFPDDVQDSFLVNQSIGYHGTRWDRIFPDGSAWKPEKMPQDLVECSDVNYRPVAMEIGPDGALYIADWCNPIVGHMQYSVRDPRRDHTHGRIWRVRHESRPLVVPPTIASMVPELLEQLRLPERNTRQHARRRLQRARVIDVFPELTRWQAGIDPADPLADRLLLEALWLHQAHGRVDLDLLDRVATLEEPRARAGALRVLRHWLQQESIDPDHALSRLERAVNDDDMRVRLEAVLACGFVPSTAGAAVAALAAEHEMDEGLRIAMEETLTYLARYGEPTSGIARRLRLERIPLNDLLAMPLDDMVAEARLARLDTPDTKRTEGLAFLAGDDAARVHVLLAAVRQHDDAVETLAPLLLAIAPQDVAASQRDHDDLADAALDGSPAVQALALAVFQKSDLLEYKTGFDPALLTRMLAYLEPGEAAFFVEDLRSAVETKRADPMPAIEQIARHSIDRDELAGWLLELAKEVDGSDLDEFSPRHELAMAALRALNGLRTAEWPSDSDQYFIEPVATAQYEAGRAVYLDEINGCARCHGIDGRGEEGFPPLDCAPWVLGTPERAAAIVVHGLYGRLDLPDGRSFESVMDPLGANLDDGEIADVLSYVRQSWGNYATPVTTDAVVRGRAFKAQDGTPLDVVTVSLAYPLSRDAVVPVTAELASFVVRGPTAWTVVLAVVLPLSAIVALFLIIIRLSPRTGGA